MQDGLTSVLACRLLVLRNHTTYNEVVSLELSLVDCSQFLSDAGVFPLYITEYFEFRLVIAIENIGGW